VVGPDVSVIARGGIMDARGIAAAQILGASGVSLGTRSLVATKSGIPACYREQLARCPANWTVVSDAVTGRPARFIRNRFVQSLIDADVGTLGWGAQSAMIADLRRATAAHQRVDILPMLAGQGAGLAGRPMPAGKIVERLAAETRRARA
jgi:nitronate monooxygenase